MVFLFQGTTAEFSALFEQRRRLQIGLLVMLPRENMLRLTSDPSYFLPVPRLITFFF